MKGRRIRSATVLLGLPVASAVLTWGAIGVIDRPSEQSSTAFVPSVLTEAVQQRSLESAIITRGVVAETNAVAVAPRGDVWGLEGDPIYTGRLVAEHASVDSGGVVFEISGRPVIVLEGVVPMYRSLSRGSEGADVGQLEQELKRLGHLGGEPDEHFDAVTEAAIESLYGTLGYEAAHAQPAPVGHVNDETASPSTTGSVVVPRGEIIFVANLPRRVGSVAARVGQTPGGEAVTLQGTEVVVVAKVARPQAKLLRRGARAKLTDPLAGLDARGRVLSVGRHADAAGNVAVRLTPQRTLRSAVGTNLRVRIDVRETAEDALVVSLAAIYTSEDGKTYVDRVRNSTPGSRERDRIEVRLGLVGDSLVEIEPVDANLEPGDRVLIAAR